MSAICSSFNIWRGSSVFPCPRTSQLRPTFSSSPSVVVTAAAAAAASSAGRASATASIPTATTTISMAELIIRDGGPSRLLCPLPPPTSNPTAVDRLSLPLMLYLPGIDGTGFAAARQFPSLMRHFDLLTLVTPPDDRSDFESLVEVVASFLRDQVPLYPPTRPIYLLGESFGGVLALAVAARCPGLVDRVVLVNPATSFEDSLWPLLGPVISQAPSQLYKTLPIALAPVLGNPINLLRAALDGAASDATVADRIAVVVGGAGQLLGQLPLLTELLPADTLAWKLQLLQQGCIAVAPILGSVPQRVLLIVGDQDLLIPSKDEGVRLQKALPRAHLRVERGRSHALLQEGGVDLVNMMREEGALISTRRMSSHLKKRTTGAGFGAPIPIELPTDGELKRYAERTTALGRRIASPIFMSTSEDGEITIGLGNIPSPGQGPVLFVGNHQTLALDLGVLCEEMLKEKGVMLRGLAHPVIFADSLRSVGAASSSSDDASNNGSANSSQQQQGASGGGLSPFDIIPAFGRLLSGDNPFSGVGGGGGGSAQRQESSGDSRNAFAQFMVEFGAVPVSGRNLARLLQNGESVLLFPGGVREAYKRKGEDYQLFWPKRSEFVRMAAKWGATIIPFSAVGVDDSLEIILDSDELQRTPVLGQLVSSRAANLPQARRGVSAGGDDTELESFVSPLAVPKLPPKRMYFLFQKPVVTRPEDVKDRERCDDLYAEVKASVEGGLEYLLRKREQDPYADFAKRTLYEAVRSGAQAPTFPPN